VVLLDKLLPKLRQEGHKILIFSQMVKMLDLISEYCEFRNFKYERLDGRIRGTERQKAIDRFEREDDSFLFLLSTRAGGVGINLVSATVCILFDRYVDWVVVAVCYTVRLQKDLIVKVTCIWDTSGNAQLP
jgi:SNF2 family DNA or RNA helicase